MSLAFLCKKSWHTSNINNQEKVWQKEEEQKAEKRRTELLSKQMKEEREMEALRKLKGGAEGNERLTWMYSAPISATDADEYLMGKPKEADEVQDDQLKDVTSPTLFTPSAAQSLPIEPLREPRFSYSISGVRSLTP